MKIFTASQIRACDAYTIHAANMPPIDLMEKAAGQCAEWIAAHYSRDNVFEFQQNFIGDFHVGNFRNRVVAGVDIFHNNSDQYFSGGTWDTINIAAETIPTYRSFNRTNMDQLYQANGVAFTYPLISNGDIQATRGLIGSARRSANNGSEPGRPAPVLC